MAGVYVHIPLCESRCYYCDFYSSTYKGNREELIRSLCHELQDRKGYLKGESVKTLYFGGGTPSLLNLDELESLLQTVKDDYLCELQEITIEANPEDLTLDYLQGLRDLGINRLSIGVQSFHDEELRAVNRRHSATRAVSAVMDAKRVGFQNISIDLIYGLPNQTMDLWLDNLEQAISLDVPHISAYSLTFEENSRLTRMRDRGLLREVDEELSLEMFKRMRRVFREHGIMPYEISNFARPGYESKHNSSYWNYIPYLGVGPSAHSFDGCSRRWNIANTRLYIERMKNGELFHEEETLDLPTRYNEYVMTSLRKSEGISLSSICSLFGDSYHAFFIEQAIRFENAGELVREGDRCRLSEEGIFISDYIIGELLWVE